MNFTGGTSTMNSRTWIASSSNAKGEVNIDTGTDGSIEFKGDVSVGYWGAGELNMKSGSVLQSVGYLYVGQNAGSKGVMKMTGGEYSLTYPGGVVCIGHQGDGTLEIAGGALRTVGSARVSMGPFASNPNYSGSASLKISDGGILETGRFHAGYGSGHGSITVDNGTIRAAGSAGDFFENVDITIGAGGMTLDSNGFDVNGSGAVFSGASAGAVRKIGAGTFSLHDLPNAKAGVRVEQGTLQVVPYALRHRWSFNGSFADSVSGALPVLTADTALTEDGTAFKMVSTTRADLGRNVLPVDQDSTIEMWVTRRDRGTWEKLLTLGNGKSDVVMVGLQNNNEDTAIVSVVDDDAAGGKFASGNTTGLGTMTVGEKFHVSITVRRTSAATTEFTFRMKQMDGTPAGAVVLTSTGTLATLNQQNCLLGQNPWNDPSSVCDIDEIRVWDVALTDEQLTANVALGPDALPDFGSGQDVTDHETVLPEKIGGLSASDYLVHRWTFDGTLDDEVTGSGPRDFAGVAYTDDGKALRLAGGGKWANYVNLGSGLLPGDDTPVTIEFWATDREYREWAKVFSFGSSKQDLLSLNTNSGSETNPGYLTFVSTAWGHGTEDMPKFSENRFGRRLYYAIVIVPDGTGQAEAVLRIKDGDTGAFVEEHSRMVHWTPAQSGQGAFYLGVSYWNNVGPAMDYEEMRFWNAALSDAQCTANALLGPDSPPETFDAIPLTVEVAQGARLDFGGRRLRLHNLSSAGIISASAVTADGVVSPCGDGTAGVMKVDGSLTVTGTLCLDLGDRIEATGDVVLDGAKIVFNASDEEVNEYVRSHGRWALVTSSSGRVSAAGIKTGRYSFDISAGGSGLWAVMRGFFIKIR